MKQQNYKNHVHWVPLYHFITIPAMVVALFLSWYYLSSSGNRFVAGILMLMVVIIGSVSFHCRSFALKVQDRTILLEENFRHYRLTGNVLDPGLSPGQVIALRFASDDEFIELCKKSIEENLSGDQIKKLIKQWKPDYGRA